MRFFTDFRTDLALERHELIKDNVPKGIKNEQYESGCVRLTKITVEDEDGAQKLGKPQGTYITAELPSLAQYSPTDEDIINVIADELRLLLPEDGTVLVIGLGNGDITPDAVGPDSASMVLATRHLSGELVKSIGLGDLRPVAVFTPGVLGKTGMETAESVKGIADSVSPSAIIAVDALAARRLSRLGNTVQMSDTGISPGSGVGNARSAITKESVGIPVISMGIPTVVDAQTLVNDLSGENTTIDNKIGGEMIVTPREIDLVVDRAARVIAFSINKALQPHLSIEEIVMLTGG